MEICFYTRDRCSLCDDAKELLLLLQEDYSFTIKEIDIDKSEPLTEKYGLMIPVVEINGEIIQYGQIDYMTLSSNLDVKTRQ